MGLIKRDYFYYKFHECGIVPHYIEKIALQNSEYLIYSDSSRRKGIDTQAAYYLQLVPSYLKIDYFEKDSYLQRTIPEINMCGGATYLGETSSIIDFINRNLKSKFRKNLRRSIKRLEYSFNIKYRIYFGNIEREEYESIMHKLRRMFLKRFDQLKKINIAVYKWDFLYQNCFDFINGKRASLMVIYDKNEPIDISLAFHFDKIFFSVVSSYDLDYSKFSLGHISIYKEIEWCVENNYLIYDLTNGGDIEYKQNWINLTYTFDHHILFKKSSLGAFFAFLMILGYAYLKNLFKFFKLNLLFERIKNFKKIRNSKKMLSHEMVDFVVSDVGSFNIDNTIELDLKSKSSSFLRKPLNDFLYGNKLTVSEVKILKNLESDFHFYLVGPNQTVKFIKRVS